jgi:hypothetical protein
LSLGYPIVGVPSISAAAGGFASWPAGVVANLGVALAANVYGNGIDEGKCVRLRS